MTEYDAPTVASTIEFVTQAHAGQPYGDEPYVNHVLRVAAGVVGHGRWAVMAGLLHDVVEDCSVDLAALYDMAYPDAVIEAVDAVTKRKHETYDELIARAAAHPLGCIVKLADNHENRARLWRLRESDPERAERLRARYEAAAPVLIAGFPRLGEQNTFGPPVTAEEAEMLRAAAPSAP